MNYFLEKNSALFNEIPFTIKYEIDNSPSLKKDISAYLNNANKGHKYRIIYDEKDNAINQTIDNITYNLGVDYIGPSRYFLEKDGIKEDVIMLICIATRYIGGHILFPTTRYSVGNQQKSLNEIRSYRFKERLDYFLFELKRWYNGENKVEASKNVFESNKKWFLQFKSFKGYIDYFLLNDFVDTNYDIYDLSSYDGSKNKYKNIILDQPSVKYTGNYQLDLEKSYIPKVYSNYVLGCIKAIKNRTSRINKSVL